MVKKIRPLFIKRVWSCLCASGGSEELWHSDIPAEFVNMFLKESCFPDCWMNVSSVVSIFKNVGERATAENYSPVSLFSVVSKIFYTLINWRLADHLENCDLFSGFQYGFRSSCTADLLTVVSGRIKRALNSPRATWAIDNWTIDMSEPFSVLLVLAFYSSSQTQVLWNYRSGIWSYFVFSQ